MWLHFFSFIFTMARMKVLMIDVSFQFCDLFQFVSQYLTDVRAFFLLLFGLFFFYSVMGNSITLISVQRQGNMSS